MKNKKLPVIFEKAAINKNNFFFTSFYHLPRKTERYLHYHKVLELGVCLAGGGELLTDKERIPYSVGDVQLILPNQPHYNITDDDNTLWLFINIDFENISSKGLRPTDNYFKNLISKIEVSGIFSKRDFPLINSLISDIATLLQDDAMLEDNMNELLIARLATLLITLSENRFKKTEIIESTKKGRMILPAIRCISDSIKEGRRPNLNEMSKLCFVSESYFRKLFAAVMGEAPKQYIIRLQAQKAAELLATTMMLVSEIAENCGFVDNSTFYRCFIRSYGISPSEYRSNYQ